MFPILLSLTNVELESNGACLRDLMQVLVTIQMRMQTINYVFAGSERNWLGSEVSSDSDAVVSLWRFRIDGKLWIPEIGRLRMPKEFEFESPLSRGVSRFCLEFREFLEVLNRIRACLREFSAPRGYPCWGCANKIVRSDWRVSGGGIAEFESLTSAIRPPPRRLRSSTVSV